MDKYVDMDKKYFEEEEVSSIDFTNRLVLLHPLVYQEQYRKPKFLIVRATGGFGCKTYTVGNAVFYNCIFDGENARAERNDIMSVIKKEFEEEVINKYCK